MRLCVCQEERWKDPMQKMGESWKWLELWMCYLPTLHGKQMGKQWKRWLTLFWGADFIFLGCQTVKYARWQKPYWIKVAEYNLSNRWLTSKPWKHKDNPWESRLKNTFKKKQKYQWLQITGKREFTGFANILLTKETVNKEKAIIWYVNYPECGDYFIVNMYT